LDLTSTPNGLDQAPRLGRSRLFKNGKMEGVGVGRIDLRDLRKSQKKRFKS